MTPVNSIEALARPSAVSTSPLAPTRRLLDAHRKCQVLLLDQALLFGAHRELEGSRNGALARLAWSEGHLHGSPLVLELHAILLELHAGEADARAFVERETVGILLIDLVGRLGVQHQLDTCLFADLVGAGRLKLELKCVFVHLGLELGGCGSAARRLWLALGL